LLVRHLLDLGHRRIGYLGFKTAHYSGNQRYQTIASELTGASLDTSGMVLAENVDFIQETAEHLLALRPAITALICQNNLVFRTAFHLIATQGMKIPGDISVCHFGAPWEPAMTMFPLTMLEVPEARMAVAAVDMLLKLIEGKSPGEPLRFVGTLQLGKTTASPGIGGVV
jgi:DNA-binding LacI/PurR family transcriptional regulator